MCSDMVQEQLNNGFIMECHILPIKDNESQVIVVTSMFI